MENHLHRHLLAITLLYAVSCVPAASNAAGYMVKDTYYVADKSQVVWVWRHNKWSVYGPVRPGTKLFVASTYYKYYMVALPDAEVGYVQRSPSQLEYRVGFRKLTSAVAIDFQRQAKICVSKVERVGNVNSFRLVSDVYRAIHRWMPASETQQMRFGKLISPFL